MDWRRVTGEHAARLGRLDDELRELRARVATLERAPAADAAAAARPAGGRGVAAPSPSGATVRPPAAHAEPPSSGSRPPAALAPERPLRPPAPARPRRDLEELLGGRVLGFAGGVAVLLGIAFLVAMAVDRGWLDEQARVALGFAGSAALLAAGVWLHERRGHTQASRAAAAAAIAGLFASLVAGTRLYDLLALPA
jgi:uncharacterized membrane protein